MALFDIDISAVVCCKMRCSVWCSVWCSACCSMWRSMWCSVCYNVWSNGSHPPKLSMNSTEPFWHSKNSDTLPIYTHYISHTTQIFGFHDIILTTYTHYRWTPPLHIPTPYLSTHTAHLKPFMSTHTTHTTCLTTYISTHVHTSLCSMISF